MALGCKDIRIRKSDCVNKNFFSNCECNHLSFLFSLSSLWRYLSEHRSNTARLDTFQVQTDIYIHIYFEKVRTIQLWNRKTTLSAIFICICCILP